MNAKQIAEFEVIDHGIEHAQYFQGCGVSFTRFDHCVTGCGESAHDAFEDALESLAQDAYDVSSIESSEDGILFNGDKAKASTVTAYLEKQGERPCENEDCELYYYVSIRVKDTTPEIA